MPVKPIVEFGVNNTNPATPEYPSGAYKNETVPNVSQDGTPVTAKILNDMLGADEALYAEVGVTPTNVTDTALSSQKLDALRLLAGKTALRPVLIAQGLSGGYGYFSKGFTVSDPDDVGVTATGEIWKYVGAQTLPYAVPQGTDPSVGDWGLIEFNVASSIKNANGGDMQSLADDLKNIKRSQVDANPTLTFNSNFNTTNPAAISSFNHGGKDILPNRLGHRVSLQRFTGTLPTVFDIPVTFTVNPQPWRNVLFIAQVNGFLKTFTLGQLTITGYGTSTISVEPPAAEMVGATEVTCWVIGDDDQFITGDDAQQNLQTNLGGYDNITNRQQSYNLGAHNLIDGLGDHQCIFGATYSVIDADGSYNIINGGTNNQITGNTVSAMVTGDSIRHQGGYCFVGGFSVLTKGGIGNIYFGRDLESGSNSEYNAGFGRLSKTSNGASYNLYSGNNHRMLESYSACIGDTNIVRSYDFASGKNITLSCDYSAAFGENHLCLGHDHVLITGLGAVNRNAGGITQGATNTGQGAYQASSLVLKNTNIPASSGFVKTFKVDGSENININGAGTASIKALVAMKLDSGVNYVQFELNGIYDTTDGVVASTSTQINLVGTSLSSSACQIIEDTPGSASFSIEVNTGAAVTGSAIVKIEVIEF